MKQNSRRGRKRWLYGLGVIALIGGYTYWTTHRPLPLLRPIDEPAQLSIQTPTPSLTWPAGGQSAVGIVGTPILETHGPQNPMPTASTAKLITALTVIQQKPLNPGQQGPQITLGPNDVALYNSYVARDGSVVPVTAGEQISEHQMLEAMLLPSANNMADSLAIWSFGSLKDYDAAAAAFLASHGLTQTKVGAADASGFDPSTVSTPSDLVKLGELTMQNPVLAQIVGQPTAADIPLAGTVKNINTLLGTANIIGVKTGNTNQAGGVFVSASRIIINNQPLTIVTALSNASSLFEALHSSLPLIQSAQINFKPVPVVAAGSIVARYRVPWGASVAAAAAHDLDVTTWNGATVPATINLKPIPVNASAGSTVGSITVADSALAGRAATSLTLQTAPTKPSLLWRLLHP